MTEPLAFTFEDDGSIPNSILPLLVYRTRYPLTRPPSSGSSPPMAGRPHGVTACIHFITFIVRRTRSLVLPAVRRPCCSAALAGQCCRFRQAMSL